MKILIISYYFPPLNSIGSLRPHSWAKYWSRMGHDVTVLTFKKFNENHNLDLDNTGFEIVTIESKIFNQLSNFIANKNKLTNKLISDNYINNKVTSKFSKPKSLMLNYLRIFKRKTGIFSTIRMPDLSDIFIFNINKVSKKLAKYDVCVSTAGPYSVHLIAYRLKLKKHFNYWLADYRDLWTQNSYFGGLFPFTIFEEFLERLVNRKAAAITTVSLPLQKKLEEKYRRNNVFTIENGFDPEDLLKIQGKSKLWNDHKMRIIYTGTIYPSSRDPSPLFIAIKRISKSNCADLLENLEVLFAGGNTNLEKLIQKYNVSKYVKYLGYITREKVLLMQRDATILLFLESDDKKFNGIVTGKLFEYLASGSFIWGIGITSNSTSGKIIEDSNSGKCFGKDINKIQLELISLLEGNYLPSQNMKKEIIEKYSREILAKQLLDIIYRIVKN